MSKSKPCSVRVERELLHRLRAIPNDPLAREVALSRVVNLALKEWLEREERKGKADEA